MLVNSSPFENIANALGQFKEQFLLPNCIAHAPETSHIHNWDRWITRDRLSGVGLLQKKEKVWTLIVKSYSELWNAIDHQRLIGEMRPGIKYKLVLLFHTSKIHDFLLNKMRCVILVKNSPGKKNLLTRNWKQIMIFL